MGFWKRLFGGSSAIDHPLVDSGGSIVMFVFRDTQDFMKRPEFTSVVHRIQSDRDTIVRKTRSMLDVTLHACSGSLGLPPEGRPPAARVLAEWLRDGTFGADSADLERDFRDSLNPELLQDDQAAGRNLGFFPYVVVVGPLSPRYTDDLQSALAATFPNSLGFICFRHATAVTHIAKALYFGGEIEMQL